MDGPRKEETVRSFGYDALGNLASRGTDGGLQLQRFDSLANGPHALDRVTKAGELNPTLPFTYGAVHTHPTVAGHLDAIVTKGPFRGEPARPFLESRTRSER